MTNYFPYSHIILALVNETKSVFSAYSFFGDWFVAEGPSEPSATASSEISELYY